MGVYKVYRNDCARALQPSVVFQNTTVSMYDIWNILQKSEPISFPFSIAIYSGFEYRKYQSIKDLKSNIVGIYQNTENSEEMLHLLLTPCLNNFQFFLSILSNPASRCHINFQNNLAASHLPEGSKLNFPFSSSSEQKEEILDEKYCICQHPQTQQITKDLPRQYTVLGKNIKTFKDHLIFKKTIFSIQTFLFQHPRNHKNFYSMKI